MFYLVYIFCDALEILRRKQNSTIKLKSLQIVVVFLNDMNKEMRGQKVKSQGYSLQNSQRNIKSHVIKSIYDITLMGKIG